MVYAVFILFIYKTIWTRRIIQDFLFLLFKLASDTFSHDKLTNIFRLKTCILRQKNSSAPLFLHNRTNARNTARIFYYKFII